MSERRPPVPIERQVACAKREVGYRRKVYPRLVREHKMTYETMRDEIEAMDAILVTLKTVAFEREQMSLPGIIEKPEARV